MFIGLGGIYFALILGSTLLYIDFTGSFKGYWEHFLYTHQCIFDMLGPFGIILSYIWVISIYPFYWTIRKISLLRANLILYAKIL